MRIVSLITPLRYGKSASVSRPSVSPTFSNFRVSPSAVGCPLACLLKSASAISLRSRSCASGCSESRCSAQESVAAEVSWPAKRSVTASSRMSLLGRSDSSATSFFSAARGEPGCAAARAPRAKSWITRLALVSALARELSAGWNSPRPSTHIHMLLALARISRRISRMASRYPSMPCKGRSEASVPVRKP
eukprot:scaffold578_cov243-Pinguiococcus_pyrenoidosus.AAC.19